MVTVLYISLYRGHYVYMYVKIAGTTIICKIMVNTLIYVIKGKYGTSGNMTVVILSYILRVGFSCRKIKIYIPICTTKY